MSRNAAAAELQSILESIQGLAIRGERLAEASGGIVDPVWFRGMQTSVTMAAGDLHQKGLLSAAEPAKETAP